MRRSTLLAVLLVLVAVLPAGRPAVADPLPDLEKQVDALAKPYLEAGVVVGMVVGILCDAERHVFGYGRLTADGDVAGDGRTVYEIGSITKVFTGLLLADMVRDGTVRLDQPVRELLPEGVMASREGKRQITLVDLATHTSGLARMPSNFAPVDLTNPYAGYDVGKLYEYLKGASLEHEPGTVYSYSNQGMGLLGHALARKAGVEYEALLEQRIFEPLGMKSTSITLTDEQGKRLAPGHNVDLVPAPNWTLDVLAGAGAIRSTVDDMLRFLQANLSSDDAPLAASLALARNLHFQPEGEGMRMGLGWHFGKTPGVRWHNGQTGGYHGFLGLLADDGIGVVILTNTATGVVDALGGAVMQLLAGKEVEPPEIRRPAEIDPEILDDYVGTYRLEPDFALVVTREGDRLMVRATDQPAFRVYPEAEDRFFYRVVDARVTFERDEGGKVVRMILHQGGKDMPAPRDPQAAPPTEGS